HRVISLQMEVLSVQCRSGKVSTRRWARWPTSGPNHRRLPICESRKVPDVARKNNKSLVIVESPAKARTISRILSSNYDVKASIGHVRDLPKRDLGIQVDDGFVPIYIVPKEKARTVKEIRDAAQKAGDVYLATDPDREGEGIAWHLLEAADLGALPTHRVVFHEITPEAVRASFDHPRDIDM